MFDKNKSKLVIENGWGYFPSYRSAIVDDNKSLWPIERNTVELAEIKGSQGPIYWAQEMMNNPIPEHDMFTYDDFIACYDYNLIGEKLGFYEKIDEEYNTYAGADLSVSKTDYADFTAITTMMVREDSKLQIVDGYHDKPGPERIASIFISKNMLMQWVNVCVENNGTQEFITHQLGTHRIPVIPFTTGKNKADPMVGIPYLAALIKNKNIILPTGSHRAKVYTERLINEALHFGTGHTGDVLMATWFCVDLIRRLNPAGSDTPLPNPEDMVDSLEIGYDGGELPLITDSAGDVLDDEMFDNDIMGESFDTTNLPILGGY